MNSALNAIQIKMSQLLRQRGALTRDPLATEWADQELCGSTQLLPIEQLEIYREQFWLRHTSSLAEDFPCLGAILGQAAWELMIEQYLLTSPLQSYTLRDLGAALPVFLESYSGPLTPPHRLCLDMAHLELAYTEAFDAEEPPPLDPHLLSRLPEHAWERATFKLHPTLRLLKVKYPVGDLRKQLSSTPAEPISIPDPRPQNLVIYRQELNLLYQELDPLAFALLEAFNQGLPLITASETAAQTTNDGPTRLVTEIGAWLQDWSHRGWICEVFAEI